MAEIMQGNATDAQVRSRRHAAARSRCRLALTRWRLAQIGGFLVALGPTDDPDVVGACAATMTDHAQQIKVDGISVDIVGTGGDGLVSSTTFLHLELPYASLRCAACSDAGRLLDAPGHLQLLDRVLVLRGGVRHEGLEAR